MCVYYVMLHYLCTLSMTDTSYHALLTSINRKDRHVCSDYRNMHHQLDVARQVYIYIPFQISIVLSGQLQRPNATPANSTSKIFEPCAILMSYDTFITYSHTWSMWVLKGLGEAVKTGGEGPSIRRRGFSNPVAFDGLSFHVWVFDSLPCVVERSNFVRYVLMWLASEA